MEYNLTQKETHLGNLLRRWMYLKKKIEQGLIKKKKSKTNLSV